MHLKPRMDLGGAEATARAMALTSMHTHMRMLRPFLRPPQAPINPPSLKKCMDGFLQLPPKTRGFLTWEAAFARAPASSAQRRAVCEALRAG
eukprot:4356933-Alexandrium_andersonii.AAC.1